MRRTLAYAFTFAFALAAALPVAAQDKPAPGPTVERLDLRDATIADAARLIAEVAAWNIIATPEAGALKVTLLLQQVPARAAVEAMCKASGVWYREEDGILRIMTAEQLRQDLIVRREPTVEVFTLLQPNALSIAQTIRDVFGDRVQISFGIFDSLSADAFLGQNGQNGQNGQGGQNGLGTGVNQNFNNGGNAFNQGNGGNGLGGNNNQFTSGGQNGANQANERAAERLGDDVSAAQLSRVQVADGAATGASVDGLTEARPPIWVAVNRRQNVLVVRTADEEAMGEISRLAVDLDRPLPQVLLEMKILEVRLDDGLETALDVDWIEDPDTGLLVDNTSDLANLAQVAGLGNLPLATGSIVYQYLDEHIRVRLQALEREGRVAMLATPLLLCANQEVSRIFIGEERPLVRGFEQGSIVGGGVTGGNLNQNLFVGPPIPTVEIRDIGNTLRIVPRINADRTVALTIVQDVSSVNEGGAQLPFTSTAANGTSQLQLLPVDTVNTANLQGTVVAKDGLTLAIGGLIRKEMIDRQSGLPLLMDLPLVGWLFGSTERVERQTEIILLITPHVLTTPAEAEQRSRQRMEALSLHPYHDLGDNALQRYGRSDVPGSESYRLHLQDHLLGAPEPIR